MTTPPSVPADWIFNVLPGWPHDQFTYWPDLEKAGNVLLPESFAAIAHPADRSFVVFLCFLVRDGEIHLSNVMTTHIDVPAGLDRMRRAAPMESWKRLAVIEMAKFLASADPDDLRKQNAESGLGEMRASWAKAARSWQSRIRGVAEENVLAAQQAPLKRRRNRITREHLEAVAAVYRAADASGTPPTRAVQQRFATSHSTAAKWVAAARKQGILGAPEGTRGGEATGK